MGAATILFTLALTGCASETLTPVDVSEMDRTATPDRITYTAGTYSGWWDQAPLPGQPVDLVFYNTGASKVIQTMGSPVPLSQKNLEFLHSPKWAKNVILVMDPLANTIEDSFAIDGHGAPTNKPTTPMKISGYEGWWNSTPADGNVAGLPVETVQINTDTNVLVEGYNRTTKSTQIKYTVVPDPAWPKHSIVIIDTSTNKVIHSFRIEEDGTPSY